jgi:hypothetical protein
MDLVFRIFALVLYPVLIAIIASPYLGLAYFGIVGASLWLFRVYDRSKNGPENKID